MDERESQKNPDWKTGDFSDPKVVQRAVLALLEYAEAGVVSHEHIVVAVRRAREESADREGEMLSAIVRIEENQQTMFGLAQATAVRVARLDNERELPIAQLAVLRRDLETMKTAATRLSSKVEVQETKNAAMRAKIATKIQTIEKHVDSLEEDVEDTQKRDVQRTLEKAKALEEELREVRASKTEIVREERREVRADRRQVKLWALGILGTILLAAASAAIGRWSGRPVDLHPPAPQEEHSK